MGFVGIPSAHVAAHAPSAPASYPAAPPAAPPPAPAPAPPRKAPAIEVPYGADIDSILQQSQGLGEKEIKLLKRKQANRESARRSKLRRKASGRAGGRLPPLGLDPNTPRLPAPVSPQMEVDSATKQAEELRLRNEALMLHIESLNARVSELKQFISAHGLQVPGTDPTASWPPLADEVDGEDISPGSHACTGATSAGLVDRGTTVTSNLLATGGGEGLPPLLLACTAQWCLTSSCSLLLPTGNTPRSLATPRVESPSLFAPLGRPAQHVQQQQPQWQPAAPQQQPAAPQPPPPPQQHQAPVPVPGPVRPTSAGPTPVHLGSEASAFHHVSACPSPVPSVDVSALDPSILEALLLQNPRLLGLLASVRPAPAPAPLASARC